MKTIRPLHSKNASPNSSILASSKNKFSFPKASRFPIPQENDDPDYLILPSTLDRKACSFGMGKRWEPKSSHCQNTPCPTSYRLKGAFSDQNHIIDYKKQTVKERKLFYIKPIPGPGHYDPKSPNRKHSPCCIMLGRKHIRSNSLTPSPGDYSPNFEFNYKSISANISFSKARRSDFFKNTKCVDIPIN